MTLDFQEAIRRESSLLEEAARRVPPGTAVPMCPGWDMEKLVAHVGTTLAWSARMIETRATERLDRALLPPPPTGADLLPWFRESAATLLRVLGSTDPSVPVWSFTGMRTAGWWARRQSHEVAVHRWDAQHATGTVTPLQAEHAVDGVDELLGMHTALRPEKFKGEPASIHLHATDVEGEWLLRLGPDGLSVEHGHAKGDVAARGTASDLDLFTWGRIDDATLEVFGRRELLGRLQQLTAM